MATPPAPPSTVTPALDRPKFAYRPALDGVRGVAILAVIASHTGYGLFGNGIYGVDMFFVLSGFLITTLLLEERFGTGRISLRLFWMRRAARLLPALFAVCAAVTIVTAINAVHSVRPVLNPYPAHTTLFGVATALGYVTCWVEAIFHSQLDPLSQTWSLSVEEWFYLIWPLMLLVLLRRPRHLVRNVVGLAVLALAYRVASEGLITSKWYLYCAPDQRSCQLLAGCALGAVLLVHGPRVAQYRRLVAILGVAGAACLAVLLARPLHESAAHHQAIPYEHLTVPLAAVAAAAGIGCLVVRPDLWLTRLLAFRPLVWIGRRSYGLYLYHLPILLLVSPWSTKEGHVPGRTGLVSVVLMFAAAAASYRWLERPVLLRMREYESRYRRLASVERVEHQAAPAAAALPLAAE